MDADEEIVSEFLTESRENLGRLEGELVALEKDPTASATLASIFRTIHTIKGTCGFLGFKKLEKVTHIGENLLSLLRDEELEYSSDIASGLLAMVDVVNGMLSQIESSGSDGDNDHDDLIARLRGLYTSGSSNAPAPAPVPAPPTPPHARPLPSRSTASLRRVPAAGESSAPAPTRLAEPPRRASAKLFTVPPGPVAPPPTPRTWLADEPVTTPAPSGPAVGQPAVVDTSVRVDVSVLDKLMNLVGELVLARNQILQYANTQTASTFLQATQRLSHITSELQEGVMKTRMQSIGNVFAKFPRLIRDLAQSCGKRVKLEMEGEDTELDRTLLEAIKDPLSHLVRNSVDHGIEDPATRLASGKPAEGVLRLRAYHAGGQVHVEISDDGQGIDCERIKAKALSRGLITPERASRMTEREIVNLIFAPGFSTAEKVTNVSGRGVGMDVVKTNVERIGGMVDIETRVGQGTLFRVKIPLTLAIIPAVIVTCAEERYAIPQISLLEIVHLGASADGNQIGIEWLQGTPVYRLRGQLLPLVHLGNVLLGQEISAAESQNIVVLSIDKRTFGLIVDGVDDTADIVVKPLNAHLKGIPAFAGATILGDGSVSLILDVLGLAKTAGVISEESAGANRRAAEADREREASQDTLLLCRTESDGRVAVKLALVSRLEKIRTRHIERVGDEEVVQYRGEIMPIVRLSSILPDAGGMGAAKEILDVVVHAAGGHSVGLVVEEVLDIVHQEIVIARKGSRPGVVGSVVINGRVTELLDLEALLAIPASSATGAERSAAASEAA